MRPSYSIERQGTWCCLEVSRRPCMHACLLPATVTAVTSIHHSFSSRSAPVLTKIVPQSHVASYALHKMSPAAGCTKITDSDGTGAFKASHSPSNGGWHLKNHFRIVTSPQNWSPPSNIPLLLPLPNAPSIPFCFPFCFSLVSCDALACHTPFKDSFDSRPGASRSCGRPVPAQFSIA